MKINNEKAERLGELICSLTRSCNIREEYFAASFNLSPAEVKLLKLFAFNSTLSIKELCSILHLTPGRITHIVSSLEGKKLLVRSADQNDKRNVIVSTAPKCAHFINNLHMSYLDLHQRVLDSVSEEEQEKLFQSLETLVGIFGKWVHENKV
ncbi:MAG: MarR family transcriptional regulator [Ignavibacteria bacterium]|jgi:DNA-binding MarR family transcriptional regulator|nr:MarR family transcriptional regulator [Ignavibacteria bacterium]HEX2963681.1 MarR family transcriptional regulator [Ignavibacteriales bacterium]MCU7500819.1 MarR family transcriptional regulator [Ignavibacteria bacterium]MCU7511819.1 MarR family transcriptional regulator [Ignavibacteria bacterium]MCU7520721.1 MarR family transcriptional regulator [Ignavibacteria bacterium]